VATRVLVSFPTRLGTSGVGTTAWHQITGLAALGAEVRVVCGSLETPAPGVRVEAETMRLRGLGRVPYRAVGFDRAVAWHDRRAARIVRELGAQLDVVHAWPLGGERTLRAAQDAGVPAVLERPNAHTGFAFEVVAQECRELGIEVDPSSPHLFDAARLAREEREYAAADALLCPSDFVVSTHRARGFPRDRLLRHQYGYDPSRFTVFDRPPGRPFTVLFTGRGEPRKGLHHALRAWLDSGLAETGRFVVAGRIDPGYREVLEPMLAHRSVDELGFVAEPARAMAAADVLVLPSVEEGSALVTYEARAAGCVLAVSDRTGAVCDPGRNAMVHPAGDVRTLREQLTALGSESGVLERLREASLASLHELTWAAAARRLLGAYEEARRLSPRSPRLATGAAA
jgi:glycosyltransferase involved in cell wall biosynthesis